MYVSPTDKVINGHSVWYHQYTDDLHLYLSFSPNSDDFTCTCESDVSLWFLENALFLNPTKTEAVIFGTRQHPCRIDCSDSVNVADRSVLFSDYVKLLDITLDCSDCTLSFDKHVSNIACSCYFLICALKQIRSLDTATSITLCIVTSRLDCCNSLLLGTSQRNLISYKYNVFIIYLLELQLTLSLRKAEKPALPTITNSRKAEIPAWRSLMYSCKDEISAWKFNNK